MNTDKEPDKYPEKDLTRQILGASFQVHNTLGCGFLEKVYENALAVELRARKIPFEQQLSLQVKYEEVVVGNYQTDLVVDRRVLVELKAVNRMDSVYEAQLLNYLKATGIRVGLLLNFGGPRLHYKRFVM